MSTKDFLNIGLETNKGSALQSLKDEGRAGARTFAILTLTAGAVDQQTFSLGGDTYEMHFLVTDRGLDTGVGAANAFNNTSPGPLAVPLTSAQVDVGDIISIGGEVFKVVATGPSSSTVVRGYAGSAIVAHADSTTITEAANPLTDLTNFPIPVPLTSAASAVKLLVRDAVNYFNIARNEQLGEGTVKVNKAALDVEAFVGGATNGVVFHVQPTKTPPVTAEALSFATLTAFGEGVEPASQKYSTIWRVVTAAEAAAGVIRLVSPFDVTEVVATVFDATGALKSTLIVAGDTLLWNGAVTVVANRLVEVDNGGTSDFAENDIVKIEFFA